jgi:hypothetical protein
MGAKPVAKKPMPHTKSATISVLIPPTFVAIYPAGNANKILIEFRTVPRKPTSVRFNDISFAIKGSNKRKLALNPSFKACKTFNDKNSIE